VQRCIQFTTRWGDDHRRGPGRTWPRLRSLARATRTVSIPSNS
jgi:hypothetical protein